MRINSYRNSWITGDGDKYIKVCTEPITCNTINPLAWMLPLSKVSHKNVWESAPCNWSDPITCLQPPGSGEVASAPRHPDLWRARPPQHSQHARWAWARVLALCRAGNEGPQSFHKFWNWDSEARFLKLSVDNDLFCWWPYFISTFCGLTLV